jgi:cysteine-rich repeat protein
MSELIETRIGSLIQTGVEERLGHRIHQLDDAEFLEGEVTPEACDQIEAKLSPICNELYNEGKVATCYSTATFFYAHQIPRCAVRFITSPDREYEEMTDVFVLDFAGEAVDAPDTLCGNGVLDEGESCDDGNHEIWDGCDSHCEVEPFTGCETLIEEKFVAADIANVSSTSWKAPRSHLMVNHGNAMKPMTPSLCDAAITTAMETCFDLTAQMPFVYHCNAQGEYHDAACSIRLEAYFSGLDPDNGVFTTALSGILAFTIR